MNEIQKKAVQAFTEAVEKAGSKDEYLLGMAEGMAFMAEKQAAKNRATETE